MTMAWIWTGMAVLSILCGLATGRGDLVAAAAVEGAQAAVELCVSIAGMLCLWTGVMEVMRRSGLAEKLSRLLRPMLRLLFPQVARDRETMDSIAANVSANLLGLGNAATPLGLEAARRMSRCSPGVASDALCMKIVFRVLFNSSQTSSTAFLKLPLRSREPSSVTSPPRKKSTLLIV